MAVAWLQILLSA